MYLTDILFLILRLTYDLFVPGCGVMVAGEDRSRSSSSSRGFFSAVNPFTCGTDPPLT